MVFLENRLLRNSALAFIFLQLASDLKGKKIGLVKEGFAVCEKDVISVVKSATNKLTEAGAIVEEISIPMHADGKSIWWPINAHNFSKAVSITPNLLSKLYGLILFQCDQLQQKISELQH